MTMAAEDDEERLVTLLELPGETAWAIRQASKVDDEHLVSSIQDDLVEIQDALLAPTLFPGPSTNASKRQEIKAAQGIHYSEQRVKDIFTLSDYLHLSEDICIRLFDEVTARNPNPSSPPLPSAVRLYHQYLADRLTCLKLVFDRKGIEGEDNPLLDALDDFAETLRLAKDVTLELSGGPKVKSLFHSIIDQVEECNKWIQESLDGDKRLPSTVEVGLEVAIFRIQSLRDHQRALLQTLYLMARSGTLDAEYLMELLIWLSKRKDEDGVTIMGLTVFLGATQPIPNNLNPQDHYTGYSPIVREYVERSKTLEAFYLSLTKMEFALPWMSGIMLLSFTTLVDKASRHFGNQLRVPQCVPKNLDAAYSEALSKDTLERLRTTVLPTTAVVDGHWAARRLKKEVAMRRADSQAALKLARSDDDWPEADVEYIQGPLVQVDRLVKNLLALWTPVKRWHTREMDVAKAINLGRSKPRDLTSDNNRKDFHSFVELVVTLYAELPADHDDTLWADTRLLRTIMDVPDNGGLLLLAKSLHAIGNGRLASQRLHRFLVTSESHRIDWTGILNHFRHVAVNKPPLTEIQHHMMRGNIVTKEDMEIAPEEAECLEYYCRMISNILDWHPALLGDLPATGDLDLPGLLLQLINRSLPASTIAQVLKTLTSVVKAIRAGINQAPIDRIIWELVQLGLSPAKVPNAPEAQLAIDSSRYPRWLQELHRSLAPTPTIHFDSQTNLIRLLTALVVSPRVLPDASASPQEQAVAANFKQHTLTYVLEDSVAFLSFSLAEAPKQASELHCAILSFVLTCLQDWKVERLLQTETTSTQHDNVAQTANARKVLQLARHPAFSVINRLLANDKLRVAMLTPFMYDYHHLTLVRNPFDSAFESLRLATNVVASTFDKQDYFLQILLPHLRSHPGIATSNNISVMTGIAPLDLHLSTASDIVAKMALSVSPSLPADIALTATQILRKLGQSPSFIATFFAGGKKRYGNRLYRVVADADDSLIVLDNFITCLRPRETEELGIRLKTLPARSTSADSTPKFINVIEDQSKIPGEVYDLLLEQTQTGTPSPNFAHLLLGMQGNRKGDGTVTGGTSAETTGSTCFEAIVEQLSASIPADSQEAQVAAFILEYPSLASRAFRLLLQLTQNQDTTHRTTRYLRNQTNFVERALRHLLKLMPSDSIAKDDTEDYQDLLQCQASVLQLAAVELHLVNVTSTWAQRIVKAFMEGSSSENQSYTAVDQQRPPLAIELLVNWANLQPAGEGLDAPEIIHFQSVNFEAYKTVDEHGSVIYDVAKLDAILRHETQRLLTKFSGQNTVALRKDIDQNRRAILHFLAAENRKAERISAIRYSLESWSKFLDVVLSKNYSSIPATTRINVIFELATACFRWLGSEDTSVPDLAGALSQPIFALTVALRKSQTLAERSTTGIAPADHLAIFLHNIASLVAGVQTTEVSRGFYYSSIINLLRMWEDPTMKVGISGLSETLFQRLLDVICKDALHGQEVWQTVSYTALDLIMVDMDGDSRPMIDQLDKVGFLQNVIRSIQTSDMALQTAMTDEDADLNVLYVFEAQMAFLLRMSQSKHNAAVLIRSGLFEMLTRLDVFGRRPSLELPAPNDERTDASRDRSIERYHQISLPLFQLIAQVVSAATTDAYKPCLRFLSAQSQTLLSTLSDQNSFLTLAAIEELDLLSSTITLLKRHSRDASKLAESQIAAYDVALKSLIGRFVDPQRWVPALLPVTEAEQAYARDDAPFSDLTAFQTQARNRVVELLRDLLSHFAGEVNADPYDPIFTSGGQLGTDSRSSKRLSVSCASILQAIQLLNSCIEDLGQASAIVSQISLRLNRENWTESDVEQTLSEMRYTDDLRGVSLRERQQIAMHLLGKVLESRTNLADDLLQIIESLVCLILRHMVYYDQLLTEEIKKTRRFVDPRSSEKADKELAARWKQDLLQAKEMSQYTIEALMEMPLNELMKGGAEDDAYRFTLLDTLTQRLTDFQPQRGTADA